nr:GNAT family N-acetyltransferase [Agromyces seonyuensis]
MPAAARRQPARRRDRGRRAHPAGARLVNALDIRAVRADEHDAVAALTERAFAAGPYGHLPVSDERRALVRDVAARADAGTVLVALAGDRLVGTATLVAAGGHGSRLATGDEIELRLLAVDPDAASRGVGAALTLAGAEAALELGASALVLDTGSLNLRAQRLYERLGFERLDRRPAGASPEVEDFAYRLALQPVGVVQVRLARPVEHAAVGVLGVAAYSHDYEISDDYRASIADVGPRAAEHQVWVAVDGDDGELLGTVATPRRGRTISPLGRDGELDFRLLGVAPTARGRGVGETLVRHVVRLAQWRSLERVVLNTGESMAPAQRLYERLGFVRLPEREYVMPHGELLRAYGLPAAAPAAIATA